MTVLSLPSVNRTRLRRRDRLYPNENADTNLLYGAGIHACPVWQTAPGLVACHSVDRKAGEVLTTRVRGELATERNHHQEADIIVEPVIADLPNRRLRAECGVSSR